MWQKITGLSVTQPDRWLQTKSILSDLAAIIYSFHLMPQPKINGLKKLIVKRKPPSKPSLRNVNATEGEVLKKLKTRKL